MVFPLLNIATAVKKFMVIPSKQEWEEPIPVTTFVWNAFKPCCNINGKQARPLLVEQLYVVAVLVIEGCRNHQNDGLPVSIDGEPRQGILLGLSR